MSEEEMLKSFALPAARSLSVTRQVSLLLCESDASIFLVRLQRYSESLIIWLILDYGVILISCRVQSSLSTRPPEGGGYVMPHDPPPDWLNPPAVSGPDPYDVQRTIRYGIAPGFIETLFAIRRRTQIFQTWVHVVGRLPPINNIGTLNDEENAPPPTLTTLHDAVAMFRGVKRPYDTEPTGASVVVHVLRPHVSIEFVQSLRCVARAVRVPNNTILTVQSLPLAALQATIPGIDRLITRLEFVTSDVVDPSVPERHSDRYEELLWRLP